MLGPFEVLGRHGPVEVRGTKRRAVLALLALRAGKTVSVDAMVDDVWGEAPPDTVRNTLQRHVSAVRAALRDASCDGVIETEPGGYRLAVPPDTVDVHRFTRLADWGRAAMAADDPAQAARHFEEALALWRGDALADLLYEPFAGPVARELNELRVAVTEERIAADLALGGHAQVIPELLALAVAHPLRERLRGQLMTALYRAGRQSEALRAYADLRRALVEELGIEPSAELRALEAAVLAQDPALDWRPAAPSAPTAAAAPPVPVPRTRLIGRERELEALAKVLETRRLVTLTGVGGCGKTRLALETARRSAARYAGGVYVVELAALTDPAWLASALATGLGLHLGGGLATSPPDPLAEAIAFLAEREALVVLDNCEHLLDACAEMVDELLGRCARMSVLATSREALGLEDEAAWPVPSLGLPADGEDPTASGAVQLFIDRALLAEAEFALSPDNEAAVVEICHRLDGIPLAIELAAARLSHMTPQQVAERLNDRFRLLTGGRRRTQRQQTLQAALDWSHDLLDDDERRVLRRLAVFVGSFDLDAAESVAGEHLDRPAADVLGSLVGKSMVAVERSGHGVRYRLLETVRLYAEEKLHASGEASDARGRHCRWYAERVGRLDYERAYLGFTTASRLTRDLENIRAALEWANAAGLTAAAADMASRLTATWWATGRSEEEGRFWVRRVLDSPGGVAAGDAAACLTGLGFMQMMGGDFLLARTTWEQAAAAAPDTPPALVARLLRAVIGLLVDTAEAEADLLDVERRSMELGLPAVVNGARAVLGHLRYGEGDTDEAASLFRAAAEAAHPDETYFFEIDARFALAVAAHIAGDNATCRRHARSLIAMPEAEVITSLLGHVALGLAAAGAGRADEARRRAGEVIAMARRRRVAVVANDTLLILAAAALAEGDAPRASMLLAKARGDGPVSLFRTPGSYAVYRHYRTMVASLVSPDVVEAARARAAAASVDELVDAELSRGGTASTPDG